MTQFHAVRQHDGLVYEEFSPLRAGLAPVIFDDGHAAAEFCKTMTAKSGAKFIPRPIRSVNSEWRERQIERLRSGYYKPLPWPAGLTTFRDHFPHISQKDPEKVAYTESEEKGERDIQTQISPGRYLTQYYPHLSPAEIRRYANMIGAELVTLKFASTPDDIADVYNRGPDSCMRGSSSVRAYGAGDLAVAYLERCDHITARAICWPDRKVFTRIYGDADRLKIRLEADGFEHSPRGFAGARLLRGSLPDMDIYYRNLETDGAFYIFR